jgi:hypothetical protein
MPTALQRAESAHLARDRFHDLGAVRPDDPFGDGTIAARPAVGEKQVAWICDLSDLLMP